MDSFSLGAHSPLVISIICSYNLPQHKSLSLSILLLLQLWANTALPLVVPHSDNGAFPHSLSREGQPHPAQQTTRRLRRCESSQQTTRALGLPHGLIRSVKKPEKAEGGAATTTCTGLYWDIYLGYSMPYILETKAHDHNGVTTTLCIIT